jgi:predicted RNA-binding Zn ribbon-like protein
MKPVNMVTIVPPEDRDGFRFRGGSNVVDLPATLQARRSDAPRELLKSPEDLDRWLSSAGLASTPPHSSVKDLVLVRDLREALYAILTSLSDGSDVSRHRRVLNRVASKDAAVPYMRADWVLELRGSAAALLSTLARQAVELFGSVEVKNIRQCASPTCTLFFVDSSRRGDRRWCSMAACGNKAKLAKFRGRE